MAMTVVRELLSLTVLSGFVLGFSLIIHAI